MKKGKLIGVAIIATGLLTGCVDAMPEMTEEQSALIAEYAADMLLKYSPNYNYKIADEEDVIEEIIMVETMEEVIEEESSQEAETEVVVKTETTSVETQKVEDTLDVIDAKDVDFAEVFEIDDVEIRYESMEIVSEYPTGEVGAGFSVSATNGNSLIVMHMEITNTSDAVITCDLFEKDFDISMNLNGGNYKNVSSTLLVNDFTTYIEEIPVGESREAVIVAEIEKITEDAINSCTLRMKTNESNITAKLK